jgi:hypothetical protein
LTATVQPNTTYTLKVDIGSIQGSVPTYTSTLEAGTSALATDNSSKTLMSGTFVTSTVTYYASSTDPNIGKPLDVVLAGTSNGFFTYFDNVRLTSTPGKVGN